ncbi:DUF5068 domain-containing protein [Gracilibacillus sp. S3-1-1]|uniref:DUF5068 domain-containing protein n=1 Tax=Gracilibacillus pellucidus TaxID=3095368 RepID=A0ACC6M165_9BACI|nr:DUF5068 domain-containing protein [Gracilibacillus sp. S3-1-1]MDX8044681.1 DUF5068 domain-containing protein [Gracilibacillus sp. S3-1-1]
MFRKSLFMLLIVIFAIFVAGCNNDTTDAEIEENSDESNEEVEATTEENQDNDEDETETSASTSNFSELIAYMEEKTEGTANVLYESEQSSEHEMEGVTTSINGYSLVELADFHMDFSIPFGDETDGAVLLAQITVSNDTDEDAYYMPTFYLSYTGADKHFNTYRQLLPDEELIEYYLSPDNNYLVEAGESITGYVAYPFGESILDDVLDEGTVMIDVPAPHATEGEFTDTFGEESSFQIGLSDEGTETAEANQSFYRDRVTANNMGEKVMLEEVQDMGETEEVSDFVITLDGYQFTEFTPNEEEAPRFESFENGMVLLTTKFLIDNSSDSDIALTSMSSKLSVNDGSDYVLGEGMLLDYRNNSLIESGESGELLQVYVLDKEYYEQIWKDKAFEVELGPMVGREAKDISKGKTVNFSLK